MPPRTWILPLAAALLLASSSNVSALTIDFGGPDDPSLHGTTGSLTINGPTDLGVGTFEVIWYMDFDGYEGSASNHPTLNLLGFKAFKNITAVSLDSIMSTSATTGTLVFPSKISSSTGNLCGTGPGSSSKFVCVELDAPVDATQGGEIKATFTVTGELLDEWSYKGKFGPQDGWVISETGTPPVPEPGAAMLFGVGLVVVRTALRRARRR